ncbi:hypothetical protein D9611_000795 [Ephemerocybe angulata]|uniref:Nephrocystin 3-like N-terminal domain-containing protein n=1 Tax=Ephemerocybe angulata TaxID=980116 RepID=A0A8H5BN37_9AGAR|nr:hypothetical protein D9611_000795 [Tulosesus angulatus]
MPTSGQQPSHYFSGAHSFSIGQQNNHVGDTRMSFSAPRSPSLQELLDPLQDASHIRNRKLSPPDSNCIPGTRHEFLQEVTRWVDSSLLFRNCHILWIYGCVGCGKSAIAQALADSFAERGRLAASFFFFRGAGGRSRSKKFARTVASQMALAIPSTAPFIEAAFKAHVGILANCNLASQFQLLVYGPLKAALGWLKSVVKGPFIIIVDGLDECEDREEISAFIDHMVNFFDKNRNFPLRFIISSRVEEHIRTHLEHTRQVRLLSLADNTTSEDVYSITRAAFTEALKHDRALLSCGDWPTPVELEKLATHIDGSFVFLKTVLNLVFETRKDGSDPRKRLADALEPDHGLDDLYTRTLLRSQHLPHFSDIISTIALLKEPLPISALAALLGIEIFEVLQVLVNLHAIIQVPGDNSFTPVTLFHTSLRDFILDESRSGPLHVSLYHIQRLSQRCFELAVDAENLDPDGSEPAISYALTYCPVHWQAFLDAQTSKERPLEFSLQLLVAQTHPLNTTSAHKFLTILDNVVSMYTAIDHSALAEATRTTPTLGAYDLIIALGFPSYRSGAIWAICESLNGMVKERTPSALKELSKSWQRTRAHISGLPSSYHSYHTLMAVQGSNYLVQATSSSQNAGSSALRTVLGVPKQDRYIFTYMLLGWARHLTLAVQYDPAFPFESLEEPIEMTTTDVLSGFPMGFQGWKNKIVLQAFASNVNSAVLVVQSKVSALTPGPTLEEVADAPIHQLPEGVTIPTGDWGWVPNGIPARPDWGCTKNPVSMLELLGVSHQVFIGEML